MVDHDDEGQLEARPIETGEPSDLMTALVSVAAGVSAAAKTGEGIASQLAGIQVDVGRAHRRRGGVIAAAAVVAVLVLIQGGVFLWSQVVARHERRILIECSSPSTPTDRHECFEQRELASVARTGRAASVAAKCVADGSRDVPACVEQILAADARPAEPKPAP